MNLSPSVVSVSSVSRLFSRGSEIVKALNDISFDCERDEFVGLTGPSGSGKTTLLNIIGLADRPSSGKLRINGACVQFERESEIVALRRRTIGYVFQHFNLLASLSALDNVALSLVLAGKDLQEARGSAQKHLERLGLGERADHLPHQLSGGQMQRVAIARASVHRPPIIIADEPTGNLDSHSGQVVLELLRDLSNAGTTIIMATHSERALGMCDRVIFLRDGRVEREHSVGTV